SWAEDAGGRATTPDAITSALKAKPSLVGEIMDAPETGRRNVSAEKRESNSSESSEIASSPRGPSPSAGAQSSTGEAGGWPVAAGAALSLAGRRPKWRA